MMADPISILSTTLEIIGYARKIYGYAVTAYETQKSMNKLLLYVNRVSEDLEWVREHYKSAAVGEQAQKGFLKLYIKIEGLGGGVGYQEGPVLQELRSLLQEVNYKLRPLVPEHLRDTKQSGTVPPLSKDAPVPEPKRSNRAKIRGWFHKVEKVADAKFSRQLGWPFTQEEEEKNVETLLKLRNEINNVIVRVNLDATISVDRRLAQSEQESVYCTILQWLTPTSFEVLPQDQVESSSIPSVPSEWLLKEPVFRAWESGRPWRLFIFGEPGSGKSVLASQIISYLRNMHSAERDVIVLNIYLKSADSRVQTEQQLLASFLKQIVCHHGPGHMPQEVKDLWSKRNQLPNPNVAPPKVIMELLKGQVLKFKKVYVIVDGLDEAGDDGVRHDILKHTRSLLKVGEKPQDRNKVSLLYTSRRLEVQTSNKAYQCNNCKKNGLTIYYTCKVEAAHGKDFHLCQSCALSDTACRDAPHQLEEPYSRVEMDLNPPEDVIKEYVKSLIAETVKMGESDQDSVPNDESVSDSEDEYAEDSTALGRLLRQRDNAGLVETIVEKITSANGTDQRLFMLARMQWEHVRVAISKGEVLEALKTLPKELNDSFKKTLERMTRPPVPSRQAEAAKRVVMWVSQAERVLQLGELQYAISIATWKERQTGNPDDSDDEDAGFNADWLADKKTLIANTRGLLEVTPDGCVRLCHKTASDYLKTPDVQRKWFPDAEMHMASTCLSTLLNPAFEHAISGADEEKQLADRVRSTPFVSYASQYWGFHAQRAQTEADMASKLTHFLIDREGFVAAAVQMSAYSEEQFRSGWEIRKGVNPLHVASWFGLDTMFETLMSKGYAVNKADATRHGRTPLIHACRGGHYAAVKKLLELGADPNQRDSLAVTPLFNASVKAKDESVRALYEVPDLDFDSTMKAGRTALMQASLLGFPPVITTMTRDDRTDVNKKDVSGFTALAFAATQDHVQAVKALLKVKGIDIDPRTNEGCTPLLLAAKAGNEQVVHTLLKHGADPIAKDLYGGTPLRRAIDGGHKAVVEEFKIEGTFVKDTSTDKSGKNLLFSAAVNGQALIVQLLIGEGGFDVDSRATDGSTPLHDAAGSDRLETVQALLRYKADTTLTNNDGQTAADMALANGLFDIYDLLRPSQSCSSSITHDESKLPATALARRGSSKLLEEKITQPKTDVFDSDSSGEVPLSIAIRCHHFDAARIILKAYAAEHESIDVVSIYRRTPLHEAAQSTQSDLVQMMLDLEPRPALNRTDSTGATPLSCALRICDHKAALALIEAGAEIDPLHIPSEEVLTAAIEMERPVGVEKLIYANVPIRYSHRKLAKEKGHVAIMRLLDRHKTMVQRDTGVGMNVSSAPGSMPDVHQEPETVIEDEAELVIDHASESRSPASARPAFAARPKPVAN